MILETERLYLREMEQTDFEDLCKILQDEDTMYAYEGAFSNNEVHEWLDRQIARYQKWGFGLWAVVLKETDEMIGQCGLTMQPWKETEVLEIGYLFQRSYWHNGYAIESAKACKKYRMFVNFLIRGRILALPKYQKDIYCDEEVFGKNFPASVRVLSDDEEYIKTFDNGIGAGVVFKHPCFHFDDEKFKYWDCGYILGTILIMQDMKS